MDGGGDIVESYGHNKNNGKILYAYEIEFLTFQPTWVKLGEGAKRSKFLINQNYQTRNISWAETRTSSKRRRSSSRR